MALELEFRKATGARPVPAPGEIFLTRLSMGGADSLAKTLMVLESGLERLLRGEGPPHTIVLDAVPALDDLLAAALVQRIVECEPIPPGFRAFAIYANLVRKGLNPGQLPAAESLEGMYLAVRSVSGGELTDAPTAAQFCTGWSKMARRIFESAERGENPLETPLFNSDPEFAAERAFLAHDREVFEQDLANGQTWIASVPEGPQKASAVFLRHPKSILWKYWAYESENAPVGHGYVFVAVTFRRGQWFFSTNPIHRINLSALAARLQEAENRNDPEYAREHRWYNGRHFNYSIVSTHWTDSHLADSEVLAIVKGWLKARLVARRRRARDVAYAAVGASVVFVALAVFQFAMREDGPKQLQTAAVSRSGAPSPERGVGVAPLEPEVRAVSFDPAKSVGLFVGVREFSAGGRPTGSISEVPFAADDAIDLAALFVFDLELLPASRVTLAVSGEPQKPESRQQRDKLIEHGALLTDANLTTLLREIGRLKARSDAEGLLVLSLATHGFASEGIASFLARDSWLGNLSKTAVAVIDLVREVQGSHSGRRLVLIDACRERITDGRSLGQQEVSSELWESLARADGMVIMMATVSGGFSYDDLARGNGVFTRCIIDGLRGLAEPDERGFITLEGLSEYVSDEVVNWVRDNRPEHAHQSNGIGIWYENLQTLEMPLAQIREHPGVREEAR